MQKNTYLPLKTLIAAIALAIATPTVASEQGTELEPIFVTVKGAALESRDVPASFTVITAEQIRQTPAKDILDVIRLTTGITISGRVFGNRETINIRGMESRHTLIMIDGRRVSSSDAVIGHSDFENAWVPLEAIERIEIVRGPLSSLYGSDGMGGVINIITKQAQDEWRSTISVMTGKRTDDRGGEEKNIAFRSSGPVTDNLSIVIGGNITDKEPTIDKNDPIIYEGEGKELQSLNLTLNYQINQNHSVELYHSQGYEDRNLVFSRTFKMAQELERTMTSLGHKGTFGEIDTSLRLYETSIHSINRMVGAGWGRKSENKLTDRILDGTINMPVGEQHFLTFGAELRKETLEHRGLPGGEGSLSNQAIFIQNQIDLTDNTLLTLGLRSDDHEVFGSELSPRIYLVHHLTNQVSIKGGYGEGFRSPTLKQISPDYEFRHGRTLIVGNPDVTPEHSDTIEIGIRYTDNTASAGLTLFRTNVDDLIASVAAPARPGFNRVRHSINIDKARIDGVEMEVSTELPAGFNAGLNLTHLSTEDLTTGLDLLQRPDLTANLRVGWISPDRSLSTAITGQHVGQQENTSRVGRTIVRNSLPSYNLFGLNLQKTLNNTFTLRGGVENITDVRLADKHDAYGFEIRGRFIHIGADINF